ncbi:MULTISPECIES: hypothetical protein [Halorussus]|uniref:DUF7511 domain-containing protein n=1 Tax=Halorussus TaxID=1070314 RepID=UPI000E213B4E|nr:MULTISPECIES: hypothetical protein [Halorussus]NHN60271.1 hypothetical protein [Halorussus sp. JP-T4]
MTNTAPTDTDDESPPTAPTLPDRAGELIAIVVEREAGPDECTLYPRGASDEALVTEWITAETESYVALREMR